MAANVTIGIIGTGWVGSSVAISTLHAGIAQDLLLHDARSAVAEGEAMDLAHGASFYPAATVRAADVDEMLGADAVVVAAGRGGRPNESRLDLINDNARVVRGLAERFRGYDGVVVIVTNPVDVLTFEFTRTSGMPAARVLGTGTMLDSARLRQMIGRTIGIDPQSVHAQVVGEHGDSEVVVWSGARAAGVPLSHWPAWTAETEARIATSVRTAAYEIMQRTGATNHAIGLVTAALLRALLRDEHRVLTVSRVQDGACGVRDVALSLPTVVGRSGATQVIAPEMNDTERAALDRSADVLRRAIAEVDR